MTPPPIDLDALLAAARAARAEAPGPWSFDDSGSARGWIRASSGENAVDCMDCPRVVGEHIAACSPDVIERLVLRVRELEGANIPERLVVDEWTFATFNARIANPLPPNATLLSLFSDPRTARIAELERGLKEMLDRVSKGLEMPYEPMCLLADPDDPADEKSGVDKLKTRIAQLRALADDGVNR